MRHSILALSSRAYLIDSPKCDEAKPECNRCTRAGKRCPGYREDSELTFRSMNSWVATKVPSHVESISNSASQTTPPMHIRPSTDWTQYAGARFIEHFTMPTSFLAPGYLEFLPQMLEAPSPCLQEAFLAVATSNLANISRMRHLQRISQVHYGKALHFLGSELNHPSTATKNETLTAVLLLQKHEVCNE